MKILLINPGITKAEVYAKYSAGAPSLPPLGLCYLAAVLLENGYQVKILDCAVEQISISQLKRKVLDFAPNIVGVTSTTVSYSAARIALQALKELDPQIMTVLGGAHISALPFQTMQECKEVDIGVFGEGEYTLLDVVKSIENNQSISNTDGVLYRSNGEIVQNKPREPVKSLDSLPLPARHLLKDLRLYSHTPFRGAKFTTTMITSRGCPFNCSYCDQSVFGRRWNYHSSEYVVEEMLLLKKKHDIDFISF